MDGDCYQDVRCPLCGELVFELLRGVSRGRCRRCKTRVLAGIDRRTGRLRVIMVDRAPKPGLTAVS